MLCVVSTAHVQGTATSPFPALSRDHESYRLLIRGPHPAQLAAVKSGAAQMFGVNLGSWLVPLLPAMLLPAMLHSVLFCCGATECTDPACVRLRHIFSARYSGLTWYTSMPLNNKNCSYDDIGS